ncbi:MAG: hypothetical protein AAGE52_19830 [Myxococcota bacterium]
MKLRIAFGALVAAALYWSPALWHWDATGFGDWQQFQHQWEAGRAALVRDGEVPLWNPWHCGGVFLFGDPQAQVYSPLFYLLLPFGTVAGLKIFLILHAAIGFAGMFVFARRHTGVGVVAASMASLIWAGSGFFAWHGSGGHSAFLPFYFAPWLLLAWRKAAEAWRYSAAVALIMALVLLEGGVYPFPYFCLLLAFDGLVQMSDPARRVGVVRAGAIALPLMLALGAFRLIPILNTMERYPRPTAGDDALTLQELYAMLAEREYEYSFPGHEYVWAEYGTFIGTIALALGLVGVVVAVRRAPWVTVGLLLFGGLTLGRVTDLHPWALLHELPVYGSLRVPSRFAVLLIFYLALGAGLSMDRLTLALRRFHGRFRRRIPQLAPAFLLVVVAVQIGWGNGAVIDRWRKPTVPALDHHAEYTILNFGAYTDYATFPARNVSNRGCYTGMTAYHAARDLRVGNVPQARVRQGELRRVRRTANTITADVVLEEAGDVVFNQTWARGWESDGRVVEATRGGSIVVRDVPAGEQRVALRYRPDDMRLALGAGALGAIATLLVLVFPRRRRRARPA